MNSKNVKLIHRSSQIRLCILYWLLFANSMTASGETSFFNLVEKKINLQTCQSKISLSESFQDSIPEIWDRIDLTSARMKQKAKIFPWWIPVTGGIAGAGVVALVLNSSEDEKPFEVNDDIVVLTCGTNATIDPTLNDTGSGINIVTITGTEEYGLILSGNTIIIPDTITKDFSFTVFLEDELGNTGESKVMVIIDSSPIEIDNRIHETTLNGIVTGNIFQGSSCNACNLDSFSGDTQLGSFTISPDGTYLFTPIEGFIGRAVFYLMVSGNCNRNITIEVIFNIKGEDCDLEPVITKRDTECGLSLGFISVLAEPADRYRIIWSDGEGSFERNNLPPGEYSFRLIDELGFCEDEFIIIINEIPLHLIESVEKTSATCLGGGEISIFVNTSEELEYNILFEGNLLLNFTSNQNPVNLHTLENILPGFYEITVNIKDRAARCSEALDVIIHEELLSPEAIDDIVVISLNTTWEGNVLTNDMGTGLFVTGFSYPVNGTASILENGDVTFIPNTDFSGTVIFEYTIEDTCGNASNAFVRIEVLSDCVFTTELITNASDCGLNNGQASITVFPVTGIYVIMWSTGQTGSQITNLAAGEYTVTVTDIINDCIRILSFKIDEIDATIAENIQTKNATCLNEGGIKGMFNSQYTGPFRIEVYYENEFQGAFQFSNLVFDLEPLLDLRAGTYRLVFRIMGMGIQCQEERIIEVQQEGLPMEVIQDSAVININTIWNGNVLDNDTGIGLMVISFTQSSDGTVNIQQSGEVVFNPNLNFTGETVFSYTAQDTCGTQLTANVFIEVIQDCSFTATVNINDATCGENDGSALLMLTPPTGNYQITWSSGDLGVQALNLASGPISVTVTDITNNCIKVFEGIVGDRDAKIVNSVQTIPATCTGGGNIFGMFNANHPGPYRMLIFRNGIFLGAFNFQGPDFNIAEIIQITPGNYTLITGSLTYNPECVERILIPVQEIPTVIITNDDTFQTNQNTEVSGNVLNNDIGEGLILVDITPPPNGSILYTGNGNFTYVPNSDFEGIENLVYTVIDICNTTRMGNLRIEVINGPIAGPGLVTPLTSDIILNKDIIQQQNPSKKYFVLLNRLYIPYGGNIRGYNSDIGRNAFFNPAITSYFIDTQKNNILRIKGSASDDVSISQKARITNYFLSVHAGKIYIPNKSIILFSMLGTGLETKTAHSGSTDYITGIQWTNGIIVHFNKRFSCGLTNEFNFSSGVIYSVGELKIFNKF